MHYRLALPLSAAAIIIPVLAHAHVSIKSKPAVAAVADVVVFGVGHGCEAEGGNLDTTSVTVEIPDGVTSIRPELSGFDSVSLETDDAGLVRTRLGMERHLLAIDVIAATLPGGQNKISFPVGQLTKQV